MRAEAELASAEQDLTISQTRVLQQETILKNALSRNGVASPVDFRRAIVPTDRIQVPQTEAVRADSGHGRRGPPLAARDRATAYPAW